jgi:hypothetical protein
LRIDPCRDSFSLLRESVAAFPESICSTLHRTMSAPRLRIHPASIIAGTVKLLLVGAVVVAVSPPLRARAAPYVAPVVNPFRRVMVKDRVTSISAFVQRDVHRTGLSPQDRDLPRVLRSMFPGREDAMMDPWGRRYFLRRRGDGFHVGSAGPDRRRDTRDDILSPKRALPPAR